MASATTVIWKFSRVASWSLVTHSVKQDRQDHITVGGGNGLVVIEIVGQGVGFCIVGEVLGIGQHLLCLHHVIGDDAVPLGGIGFHELHHADQGIGVLHTGGAVLGKLGVSTQGDDVRGVVEGDLHADVACVAAGLDGDGGVLGVGVAGEQMVLVGLHTVSALHRRAVGGHLGLVQRDLHVADGEGVVDRVCAGEVGQRAEHTGGYQQQGAAQGQQGFDAVPCFHGFSSCIK